MHLPEYTDVRALEILEDPKKKSTESILKSDFSEYKIIRNAEFIAIHLIVLDKITSEFFEEEYQKEGLPGFKEVYIDEKFKEKYGKEKPLLTEEEIKDRRLRYGCEYEEKYQRIYKRARKRVKIMYKVADYSLDKFVFNLGDEEFSSFYEKLKIPMNPQKWKYDINELKDFKKYLKSQGREEENIDKIVSIIQSIKNSKYQVSVALCAKISSFTILRKLKQLLNLFLEENIDFFSDSYDILFS